MKIILTTAVSAVASAGLARPKITAGRPGAEESFDLNGFRAQLVLYDGIGAAQLRCNLAQFLRHVVPVAEALGGRTDNDLPAMLRRFGERIGFFHLRSTLRERDGQSFHDAPHLGACAAWPSCAVRCIDCANWREGLPKFQALSK